MKILLSCGHKWKDSGAVFENTLKEVDVNYEQWIATASCLETLNGSLGAEFYLLLPKGLSAAELELFKRFKTYEYSSSPGKLSITDRINAANTLGAVLIELHNNIASGPTAAGAEVLVFSSEDKLGGVSEAHALAKFILAELGVTEKLRGVKPIYDRDTGAYVVPPERRPAILVKTQNTSVIVESGFLSDPVYREKITKTQHNMLIGCAIAKGISTWVKTSK